MIEREDVSSPRLAALRAALEAGNSDALAAFWQEVAVRGAPLIEPAPGDAGASLVTFLWRATTPVRTVAVVGELVGDDLAANQLTRLGETDLWYRTYRWRRDLRTCYELSPDDPLTPLPEFGAPGWEARTATWQPDPLNPRRYRVNVADTEDPGSRDKWLSVLELPAALPQPWIDPRPDVPAGRVEEYRVASALLGNERRVWVYTPAGYVADGAPYPLLVLSDGIPYIRLMRVPTTLDNMIAAGALPPLVAVLMDNPDRFRDLTDPRFPAFVATELVPWAEARYHLTHNPTRRVIGGTSLGGLAAAVVGLFHPDMFGNVLSQSGAFSLAPPDDPEPEWPARQFAATPTLPLRFYLDIGLLEHESRGEWPSLLLANRHLRTVLHAKGYPLTYLEYHGGHNYICWQGTIADGLQALLGEP
jgi:enterochelin esterase family protein